MLIVKRRADGFAEPEIEEIVDNCSDGLQQYVIKKQNSSMHENHDSAGADFEFANGEFLSGFAGDGEDMSNAGGMFAGIKKRRDKKLKMKEKRQDAKIRLKEARANAKEIKANAKQTKADAKVGKADAKKLASQSQIESAKALANQSGTPAVTDTPVVDDSTQPKDKSKTTKIIVFSGLALVVLVGGFLAYKHFKKK